jgi:hypothetical protein
MTLERGNIGGYEFDRMVFLFSMTDGDKDVPCAVSTSAMDDMEHVARTRAEAREAQFLRLQSSVSGWRFARGTSLKGQTRRFDDAPITSGLPL